MLSEGEYIYLLDSNGKRYWMVLEDGMMEIHGLGVVNGGRVVGKKSGSRINIAGRDFWALSPGTGELMGAIERGAQIITEKDVETIIFRTDLKSGDTVIEGGLGSGSLTLALLGAVAPEGRVISVEIRDDFAETARKNIERAGRLHRWLPKKGDITQISLDEEGDAVILDIPNPWDALDNVVRLLRSGGRFCAYVPNTNQVERTVNGLRARNFVEVYALENIQRGMKVHSGGIRPSFDNLGHTGYMVFARHVEGG